MGRRAEGRQDGHDHGAIGLIVFLFFGVFFELLLNISGFRSGMFGRILFPLMIIGAGVGLLFLACPRAGARVRGRQAPEAVSMNAGRP